jgi:hypothetical protein
MGFFEWIGESFHPGTVQQDQNNAWHPKIDALYGPNLG